MIIGQTLNAIDGEDAYYFTPWFPRVADNAIFTFQRIEDTLTGGGAVVEVFHKNAEDAGTGSSVTEFSSQLGSTDLYEAACTGLKEMVRFRIMVKDGTGWIHFRFLPPTWYPTGKV
jgi:hypothetical protein